MRISDWSSDVCSSDLFATEEDAFGFFHAGGGEDACACAEDHAGGGVFGDEKHDAGRDAFRRQHLLGFWRHQVRGHARIGDGGQRVALDVRSEEHTSELQSLMRTSYAVFGLKKK